MREYRRASAPNPPFPPTETAADARRWPALSAFATVGIVPATTARRTEQVSLGAAYMVHLIGALGAVILAVMLAAWAEVRGPVTLTDVFAEVLDFLDDFMHELVQHPVATPLIAVGCIVGVEVGWLLGALLCTSWGATDEPYRASIRHAIRRAWLHTPHIALVLLLAGGPTVYLMRATNEYWNSANYGGDAWKTALEREVEPSPFYVRYDDEIAAVLWFVGGAWWLWSLLRFIGVPRNVVPVARPPTCENCGYNLTGIALDGRCPECGDATVLSLGPEVRAATPWQRYRPLGRWHALRRCTSEATQRPTWLGRQLPLSGQHGDHRWALAGSLPVLFLIGWAGAIVCFVADMGRLPLEQNTEVLWAVGPIFGYFVAVGGVTVALLTAGLVGLAYRIKSGRNLLAGAMQAACYSVRYLVLWFILAFVFGAAAFLADDAARQSGMRSYQRELLVLGFLVFLPNLAGLAGYIWLVARITAGTRYANR